jgi:hypothetical protein
VQRLTARKNFLDVFEIPEIMHDKIIDQLAIVLNYAFVVDLFAVYIYNTAAGF